MITLAQINAETDTALSNEQILALKVLIQSYKPYAKATAKWPGLPLKLASVNPAPSDNADEAEIKKAKRKALKAVLTAVGQLPSLVVESQGTEDAPSFFATRANWDELAQNTLDILYDAPVYIQGQFAVVQRRLKDLVLDGGSVTLII